MFATLSLIIGIYSWLVIAWAVSTWLPQDIQQSVRPVLDPVVEPAVNAVAQVLPPEFRNFAALVLIIGLNVLQRIF